MDRPLGSATSADTPRRVDAERNRARLLEAARRRVDDGDTTLGLNAVARSAGVGVATAYRHFPDRQALVEGLAADSLAALVQEARAAAAESDAEVGLGRLMRAGLVAMAADPVLAEVLSSSSPVSPGTIGLSRDLGEAVDDLLARARATGACRDHLGPDDVRRLLAGVHAAARAGDDPPAAGERYLDVLLAGLRPPAARVTRA